MKKPAIDLIAVQVQDNVLMELTIWLQNDELSATVANGYLIHENLLYFISNINSNQLFRLYISKQLKPDVIKQYHGNNGCMGVDKTYDAIKNKTYLPNKGFVQLCHQLCTLSDWTFRCFRSLTHDVIP